MRHFAALYLCLLLVTLAAPVAAQTADPTTPLPAVRGEAILNRGVDAATAGDIEQAMLDFSLFILLNPTDARGHYLRGLTYFNLEQDQAALANYTEALRYSAPIPELHASLLVARSEIYLLLDDREAALGDMTSLIETQPSSEAYAQRGVLQLTELAFDEALADLDEAIDLAPTAQPVLYFYRAIAQDALQNQTAAASDYFEWVSGMSQQTTDEEPLQSGGAVTLQMAQNVAYRIPFEAEKGQEISILARNIGGDVDPLLIIVGPDGTPLISNDDARTGSDFNAVVVGFPAPESGDYSVLVSHALGGYDGRIQVLLETR